MPSPVPISRVSTDTMRGRGSALVAALLLAGLRCSASSPTANPLLPRGSEPSNDVASCNSCCCLQAAATLSDHRLCSASESTCVIPPGAAPISTAPGKAVVWVMRLASLINVNFAPARESGGGCLVAGANGRAAPDEFLPAGSALPRSAGIAFAGARAGEGEGWVTASSCRWLAFDNGEPTFTRVSVNGDGGGDDTAPVGLALAAGGGGGTTGRILIPRDAVVNCTNATGGDAATLTLAARNRDWATDGDKSSNEQPRWLHRALKTARP
jgi:hypothetical protein